MKRGLLAAVIAATALVAVPGEPVVPRRDRLPPKRPPKLNRRLIEGEPRSNRALRRIKGRMA